MKQFYFAILLLLGLSFGYANEKNALLLPTATIAGTTTVCQNATNPVITFTGSLGTAPYTFTYTINGGANQTSLPSTGNITTIPVSTATVGIFTYTLVSVKDSTNATQNQTGSAIVTVISPFNVTAGTDLLICKGNPINLTSNVTGNGSNAVTYSWSGPNGYTSNQQSPTIPSSTGSMSGNYTVTASVGSCQVQDVMNVTILEPTVSSAQLQNYNGTEWLVKCTSPGATSGIVFISNGLAGNLQSHVSNYSIDWGDIGTPIYTSSSATWNINHSYNVGLYTLIIIINTDLGCTVTRNYTVFVGNQPASPQIQLPANAQGCAPFSLTFPISGVSANVPGTTYTITFSDDLSNPLTFTQFNIPTSITKVFNTTSCNSTFTNGSNVENNAFGVSIRAVNPCGSASSSAGPIRTSSMPTALFTIPSTGCINQTISSNNQSINGSVVTSNQCDAGSGRYWEISPSTGWILTSSVLGNDGGFPNDFQGWVNGSLNLNIQFNILGQYTINLIERNACSQTSIDTKTICIEPPLLIPQVALSTNSGCIPLAVTATNNIVQTNQCAPPTYLWAVTYASGNCGSASAFTYTGGTSATSANPSFNFTESGTYSIKVTMTNSCGAVTSPIKTVVVKKPPTASIATIPNSCGTANITPTATINSCAPASSTLTYAWSFPGGTPATVNTANPGTINYPTTGNYTVSLIVTNECGASNTATQTFSVSTAPVITNTTLNQTICSGSQTTLVNLNANPATTTFTWTATATTGISGFTTSGSTNTIPVQTITTTNTSAGTVTYVITPTVGGCNGTPINYIVNVNPAPSITTQPSPSTICIGGTPTILSVALNSSAVTPTYQWYSNTSSSTTGGTLITGATNATYNPPATVAGTLYYYCVISLSSGGCSGITSTIVAVVVNPLPTITTQPVPTQNLCVGVTIASPLTVSYSGGTGTATYQWHSNTNNTTTGGTPVGTNSPNYTPPVFTTAAVYYYYVTISLSGNNCGTTTSNTAQVTVFGDPTITTQPIVTQTLCQGATPTTLQVAATGGNGVFSYQWYTNSANNTTSGTAISGANSTTYIPPITTVGTLYYYCIISQTATAGCSVTSATAAVIINASPTIVNQPISSTVCSGGTPTVLSLTYSNGAGTPTYQWYSNTVNNNTTGTAISGETNPTFSPPATVVGTIYYYCTITFSGIVGSCATVATNTADVTVTAGSTINQQPQPTQNLCVGVTIPNPLTVTYMGGTGSPSYQWFSNTTNSNVGGTAITGATNVNYTPPVYTTSGNYYYYVVINFSGNGCGAITSSVAEVIIVNDPIITTQPLATQTVCQNTTATILTVATSGGLGTTYNYQWYSSSTNNTTSGTAISGETNSTFTPPTITAGTVYYYCIITQAVGSGCNATTNTAEVIVNVAPAVANQPLSSTVCVNGSPTVLSFTYTNGVGTPTYQWYSNTSNSNTGGSIITSATNATNAPLAVASGTTYYYCVITFSSLSGGCSVITTNPASIIVNDNPVIVSTSATICSTTTFTVTPTNGGGNIVPTGTTYTWSAPTINPAGSITGASAQLTPQTNISQTLINTTTNPSTVTYTVIPTSGVCFGATFTVIITVNPAINPNIVLNDNLCFGVNSATITTNITGGIPFSSGTPYNISWTGPNGFTSTSTSISNLAPGNYDVTIADAGGCPFSNTYTITEPADIVISLDNENDITCFNSANGSINITVTGGTGNYVYTWTKNSNPYATSEDISNLSPGIYNVSVTDVNNCGPKTATFTITEPPLLVVNLVSQTNVLCYGAATGAITVNVFGGTLGTGYIFSWTGPNGFTSSTQNLNNIAAGTYNLVVTDANGCQMNLAVTITQSTEIIIAYTTTPITCYGANNASLTVTISGGNPPYQFQWSNLSTSLIQTNLSAGNYTITVTDNVGCPKILTINIPEAPVFTVNPIVSNITCFGAHNGSINLNLTGGIAPVALVWSDASTSGLIRNNLAAGTYTATISDGTPCYIVRTFTIVEPQAIVLSANLTNAFNCTNPNSGAIDLIVAGGTPPYTYSWSNGSTTEDLNNITSGNYLATVTDANGCIKTAQFSITRPDPLLINVTTQTTFDCAAHSVNQNFTAQASGGIPPYQYQWSSGTISGANNEIMHSSVNGTVLLTVTDSYGCVATQTVVVDTPELGYAAFEPTSNGYITYGIYSIGDPIQFNSNITGDYVSISWDFGDGTFSTEVNPLHTYLIPKDYIITQTVTYPFGCVYIQTISLIIEKGYVLVVPTAFTPNNDSVNDRYRPVTKRLKNVQLDIYDTWGSLIYSETGDVLMGWDAKIKGFDAENGNYYSKVKGETFYGTIVNSNQTFVLIK